jgi:hypothetical protein
LSASLERSGASRLGGRKVMFADRNHGASLRAFCALAMLRDETHLVADGEVGEPAIGDAIAVEIDLGAVRGQDEPAIPIGKQAYDPPVVGHRALLHIAPRLSNMIFQHPANRIEGVANRDMGILVRVTAVRITTHDDLAPWDDEIDTDFKQIALAASRMPTFDDDAAGDDPVEKALEILRASADARGEGFRAVHVAKSDLKRDLHSFLRSATGRKSGFQMH